MNILKTLAGTLGIAVALAACAEQPSEEAQNSHADMIVTNADIYTADAQIERATSFAVKDGRFIAVGGSEIATKYAGSETRLIDAGGKTVVPGFIDGHTHLQSGLRLITGVDLSYIPEKSKWLELVAARAAELPEGSWILGGNWDYTLGEGALPTKEDLDGAAPNHPVLLQDIDGHSAWANSKAIELAGVTADTPVPPGGEILVDPDTGEPTGIFLEGAMRVFDGLPGIARTHEQTLEALKLAVAKANSLGITGAHDMGSIVGPDNYLSLLETSDLTLRVWYGTYVSGPGDVAALAEKREEVSSLVTPFEEQQALGPLLKVGYVKSVIDGVLSTHTAVLKEPYADRPGHVGELFRSEDDLAGIIAASNLSGFPVAVHAIGDGGVETVLNAFANGSAPTGLPNRVEHIEVVTPDDVQRFKDLGIAASMQPNHATGTIGKYINERLGDERENNAYVWQSMLKAGVPLAFGSDWPTSPLPPLTQLNDAIFRESPFGLGNGPWHPEEAVSFKQALHAYTQGSANLTPWASDVGSISVGKYADFVILDGTLPVPFDRSFRARKVEATYLAGKLVYSNNE